MRVKGSASLRKGIGRFDTLLLAGAVLIVFLLLGPLLTIPLRIPLSYNEGWNAYFDQLAVGAGAGPLYPAADSLVFNNYPPFSFYLVGAFGRGSCWVPGWWFLVTRPGSR
jgi:hypothetical protein